MKRIIYVIRYSLILLFLVLNLPKTLSQCLVDYTTYNYFCDLDTLILEAVPVEGVGPFSFIWETGETTQTILIPLALGDYMLTMTDANGCTSIINCHIKPFPEVLFYPFAQDACEGDTVTLWLDWFRDSLPGATYLWSTGETTPTIQITDDIIWSVTVTDPATGCSFEIPPGLFDFHETPTPVIVGPNLLCDGQSIVLHVEGGPFGVIWWEDVDLYQDTLIVTTPGEYIAWGSSLTAGYCWNQDTINITEGDISPPNLIGPPTLCPGQNGIIDITNSNLYAEFLWNNGETSSSISVDQPGTYYVTVTNSGGCTASGVYTINSGAGATLSSTIAASTCGENNGSINLSTSPPGTYVYIWSNGQNTEDLFNIPGGNYTVTVTSSNGCTSIGVFNVPDNQIPISISDEITNVTSCISNDGAIDITITPGGSYSYLWSNGATTEDLNNLASGNYSVTVTTGNNCIESADFVVDNLAAEPDIETIPSQATCGENNGSIDLQVTNGEAPYSFLWSNGNTTSTLNNIPGGTYSVTVTGANACTSSAIIILPDNYIPIVISGLITPNSSCNASNGGIDITLSPPGAYNFIWSNGSTVEDLTNLGAGTYGVTATLGNNCIQTESFTVSNENIPFNISESTLPNTSCLSSTGSIDLTISPTGNYSFLWSTGETSEDLQNLEPGNYIVSVTNSDGCLITASFDIVSSIPFIAISGIANANTSCQTPNGSVDITVSPSGSYTYAWSNGATTEDLQNLSAGSYEVTISGSNGCTTDSIFIVDNQSAVFSLSANVVPNNSCVNPNGSIDLSVSPSGSYTFHWSNGTTTEDQSLLGSGIYNVTVSDINLCTSVANFVIDDSNIVPLVTSLITPETCGSSNGNIDLNVIPAGNTFIWSNGSTTEDLQNITQGTYVVTVTAINGCSKQDTFIIDNLNSNFSLSGISNPNNSCLQSNGSLDLVVTPFGSYNFLWSNGMTTEDLQNISSGQYTVTVTDPFNCASSLTLTVDDNIVTPVLTSTITPATCSQNNGSIDLSVIPATGNTYLWSNGSNHEDLNNIEPGTYVVTVTGSNGCEAIMSIDLPGENSNLLMSGIAHPDVSCTSSNGSLDLMITPIGSYTFLWSNGALTQNLQNLAPGIYTVTVTDALGCSSSDSFIIDDSTSGPSITPEIISSTCGQNNGSILLGISPSGPNFFLWSNGNTTQDLINVYHGQYSVTVSDINGCSSVVILDIPDTTTNFSIVANVVDNISCTDPTGSIDLSFTPIGTYSSIWSNGSTSEDLSNLSPGDYAVTVTDNTGCTSTQTFTIANNASKPVISDVVTHASCGENNAMIDLTVNPTVGNQYLWSTGDTSEDLDFIQGGLYSVTVTDLNGCTVTEDYFISSTEPVEVIIDADLTAINTGIVTCYLHLNVPLSSLDTIVWMPEGIFNCNQRTCVEQTFTLTQQTEVMVMVMDTNGCIGQANILLDIDKEHKVYIPNVITANGDGINDRFTIFGNKEVKEIVELQIFDRWGNCVFINESFPPNEPGFGWDGEFKGQSMNPDVFAYWAKVRYTDDNEQLFKGDVTLLR